MSTFRLALLAVPLVILAGCGSPPEPTKNAPQETDPDFFKGGSRVKGGGPSGDPSAPDKPDPHRIAVAPDGGAWPWNLAAAPAPQTTRPVAIANAKQGLYGFAVNVAAKRAVVAVRLPPKGDGNRTRLVLCDLAGGKGVREWELPGRVIPHDISNDGYTILARQFKDTAGDGETLVLFTIAADYALKRKGWRPHDPALGSGASGSGLSVNAGDSPAEREARQVLWAKFLPGDRVASLSLSGQFRVFDAQTQALVGSVEAVPAVPAFTPDGSKVAVLMPGGVALYDSTTNTFVGSRRLDPVPNKASLAFSPSGKLLAVGGDGRITYLDLSNGVSWSNAVDEFTLRSKAESRSFGWAGDAHLIAGGTLYAPHLPIALWRYSGAELDTVIGRELWAAVNADASGATRVLRSFTLPHPRAASGHASHISESGVSLLKPGDPVRIDVTGVPPEQQEQVRTDLHNRLKELGYQPAANAPSALVASVDKNAAPASFAFVGHSSVAYNRRPARLVLVKDGKELWANDRALEPPAFMLPDPRQSADYVARGGYGGPDYNLFKFAPIPHLFPGIRAPALGFGTSSLRPEGVADR